MYLRDSERVNDAGVLVSCIFLAGQQNSNTPAPHSALFFFFYLTFLIFDIGINRPEKHILKICEWQTESEPRH